MEEINLMKVVPFICWQTEGNISFEGCLSPIYHKDLLKNNIRYRAGGACGDICSGGHIQPYMLLPYGHKRLEKKTFKRKCINGKKILKNIFKENFIKKNQQKFENIFFKSFSRIKEDKFANKYDIWDFSNRQKRYVFSSSAVDTYNFMKIQCFLNKDLLDFWTTIPLRGRFLQRFYKKAILKINDKIKNVPWAHTGRKIQAYFLFDLVLQIYEYVRKRIRKIFKSSYFDKNTQMINMVNLIRKNSAYKKEIEDFLDSEYFPTEIFNRKIIHRLLKEHYAKKRDASNILNLIMTVNMNLKYFQKNIEKPPREIEEFVRLSMEAAQ